jgi:hypothetical protein
MGWVNAGLQLFREDDGIASSLLITVKRASCQTTTTREKVLTCHGLAEWILNPGSGRSHPDMGFAGS